MKIKPSTTMFMALDWLNLSGDAGCYSPQLVVYLFVWGVANGERGQIYFDNWCGIETKWKRNKNK